MSKLKIRFQTLDMGLPYRKIRKKNYPTCQKCGAKLKDEKSIKRGYGHKCIGSLTTVIILEIKPENEVVQS